MDEIKALLTGVIRFLETINKVDDIELTNIKIYDGYAIVSFNDHEGEKFDLFFLPSLNGIAIQNSNLDDWYEIEEKLSEEEKDYIRGI